MQIGSRETPASTSEPDSVDECYADQQAPVPSDDDEQEMTCARARARSRFKKNKGRAGGMSTASGQGEQVHAGNVRMPPLYLPT
jgi:ribosome assembly protein YihI (activator of Der GTPase)